jgi:lysine 2,3-aminomutase
VDLPGGGGKVTLQPDYLLGPGGPEAPPAPGGATGPSRQPVPGHWFRDFRGERRYYPEPPESDLSCPYDEVFYRP